MLTDLESLREQCRKFAKVFPNIKLFYAVKAFSDVEVIAAVEPLVAGYDAASTAEIELVLRQGVAPERIAFSNPVKSEAAIAHAHKVGVHKFSFQSRGELAKLAKHAPASEVYVRVKMDDSEGSVALSSKFGCVPEEAVELLLAAKALGLKPIGLTFHVGSQATELPAWPNAIYRAQKLVGEARGKGLQIELVNLGGGFPVQYKTGDPRLEQVAATVNDAIGALADVTYMAEPGRFVAADSSVIVSSVIGVEDREGRTWLYIDVSTFHAFMEVFEFHEFLHPVLSLRHVGQQPGGLKDYVLTGPSCDSYDTMSLHVQLPADMQVGDQLLITMAGAYTVVYGSEFNGFKVPPRHFLNAA
jgi:ornithine decarboxylase